MGYSTTLHVGLDMHESMTTVVYVLIIFHKQGLFS
jgi:hypothetical protein